MTKEPHTLCRCRFRGGAVAIFRVRSHPARVLASSRGLLRVDIARNSVSSGPNLDFLPVEGNHINCRALIKLGPSLHDKRTLRGHRGLFRSGRGFLRCVLICNLGGVLLGGQPFLAAISYCTIRVMPAIDPSSRPPKSLSDPALLHRICRARGGRAFSSTSKLSLITYKWLRLKLFAPRGELPGFPYSLSLVPP